MRLFIPCILLVSVSTGSASGQVKYFPDRALSAQKRSDRFKSDWYSNQLQALEEPSLWELSQSETERRESYRFLWLRTFQHPVAIRVDIEESGAALLAVKVASGAGGYAPGKLIRNENIALTKEQCAHFLDIIEKNRFWELPTLDESHIGMDGAQWVMEGVKDGKYHLVDRWSPGDGAIRTIGLALVKDFAKLKIPSKEIY